MGSVGLRLPPHFFGSLKVIELLNRSETSLKVFVKSQRTSSGSFINHKHHALFGLLTLSAWSHN